LHLYLLATALIIHLLHASLQVPEQAAGAALLSSWRIKPAAAAAAVFPYLV